jgi:hypothetical protein
VALRSGVEPVQIGAKLRAADGCNVVYAMVRIEPDPEIKVQVKRNPGAHTHDDCGTSGYRAVAPSAKLPLPLIAEGSSHRMRAFLEGRALRVWFDEELAWAGDVGDEVSSFNGPVGIRTDNGRFDVVLVPFGP